MIEKEHQCTSYTFHLVKAYLTQQKFREIIKAETGRGNAIKKYLPDLLVYKIVPESALTFPAHVL